MKSVRMVTGTPTTKISTGSPCAGPLMLSHLVGLCTDRYAFGTPADN
ncbi:hypothetical protein [Streptacidiphilus neutrinimicus]|nr:hypothetical protein [Streptacidiphilus neutrinimicus]